MAENNPEDAIPTSQETTTIQGSCLCRGIQYTIHGAPIISALCHCDNCRKASGSAFATNSRYARDQFTVTHGHDLLRTFDDTDTDSGATLRRAFCGMCGSPLFITFPTAAAGGKQGFVVVMMGSADGLQHAWRPDRELYCKRKQGFVPEVEGTVCHDEMALIASKKAKKSNHGGRLNWDGKWEVTLWWIDRGLA